MSDRYQFQIATSPQEINAYFALRHLIFCTEQALFNHSDVDAIDQFAYPIIALDRQPMHPLTVNHPPTVTHPSTVTHLPTVNHPIVGVVRIYEAEPRLWYGGRLGTHPDYRRGWQIGKGLIEKAVTTAHAWGCDRFLATVQLQNVRFFQRLHWHSLEEMIICDRPHHLMAADLNFYPANPELSNSERREAYSYAVRSGHPATTIA